MMMSRSVEQSVELWEYQCPGIAFPWSPAGATLKNKTFLYVFGALFTLFLPPPCPTPHPTYPLCLPATKYNFILYPPSMLMCAHMCMCVYVCVTKFSHIYIKKMLNMWVEKRRSRRRRRLVPAMQSRPRQTRSISHNVTLPYTDWAYVFCLKFEISRNLNNQT